MTNKKVLPLIVLGAIALVVTAGVLSYQAVRAQSPTATPAATQPDAKGGRGGLPDKGQREQNLATALGISLEKLQAAEQTAVSEALKQAVDKGLLTQEQADRLTARGLDTKHLRENQLSLSGIDYNVLLAKALGISVEKLQAAYQAATASGIDQAVKEGRLTQGQADLMKGRYSLNNSSKFQDAMKSAFEAAVKQAVTDGVITQSQADQILKDNDGFRNPGYKDFNGQPGNHRHGGPDNNPNDQNK